jgi:hypothetical protein
MQRILLPLAAAVVFAACASGHTSQTTAKIPKPDVTIIQRTNVNENIPTVPSGITVHYELRITNKAQVAITLKRVDLDALPGGGFNVESRSRPFHETINPGETKSVDFPTSVFVDPRQYSSQAPVGIRAVLLFDSREGSLQTVKQQRVSANSGD